MRSRLAPLALLVVVGAAGGIAWIVGARDAGPRPEPSDLDVVVEEGEGEVEVEAPAGAEAPRPDALPAGGEGGIPAAAGEPGDYQCTLPDVPIVRDPRCDEGAPYPACRWQLADTPDAHGLWVVWRSTTPDHRWARPGLVTLVMAAAADYQRRWPGEHLTIGDLDAAGPRHQTHDRGVDVDLYLEHAMLDVNEGPHRYVDNYASRPAAEVASLRTRVADLAHILATCSHGRERIYYNDREILDPFVAWFSAHGFTSDVGPAMQMHNRLHRFHFHMTVPEDLPPISVSVPR